MRKRRAFTLIELLVVVAIIALLLSILTPALNQVKEAGRKVVCNSNVKQLGMAYTMYAQLYGGHFVPVEIWDPLLADEALKGGGYDMTLLNGEVITPYIPIWCFNKQFIKLLDQRGGENAGLEIVPNPFDYYALPQAFRCPSFPVDKKEEFGSLTSTTIIRTTYAPNITDWVRADAEFGEGSPQERAMQDRIWNKGPLVDKIKRPADKILFTDAKDVYLTYAWDQGNYILHWDVHGEIGWGYTSNDGLDHGPEPMYRHNEGANIIFCDGHAEYRKKNEMFYFLNGNTPDADGTNVDILRNDKLWCYFK